MNVQLDNTELAPSFLPEDVTKKLGLPDDLQAEKVFVHKTANYENYIVVQEGRVVAYTYAARETPLLVLSLQEGETVRDITAVGNTLIIATPANMYYILYKNKEYAFLGHKVPFPYIGFERTDIGSIGEDLVINKASDNHSSKDEGFWFVGKSANRYIPSEKDWNDDSSESEDHKNPDILLFLKDVWDLLDSRLKEARANGYYTTPVAVRYAVELYDGTISSMPLVVPSPNGDKMTVSIRTLVSLDWDFTTDEEGNVSGYDTTIYSEYAEISPDLQKYKVYAKLLSEYNFMEWADIIKSINIYISEPCPVSARQKASVLSYRNEDYEETDHKFEVNGGEEGWYEKVFTSWTATSSGNVSFRKIDWEDELLFRTAQTFLVKKIDVFNENKTSVSEELKSLIGGETLDLGKFMNPEASDFIQLETQERLSGDDMKHYAQTADRLASYNNSLILIQPSQTIEYDYDRLNAYDAAPGYDSYQKVTYDVTYLIKGYKEDKVVKKSFSYVKDSERRELIYPFQIFPDSRAYKMLLKVTMESNDDGDLNDLETFVRYGEFDMLPHPYLECAYYYGGLNYELWMKCHELSGKDYTVNAIDDLENKLMVSEINNPFTFPLEHRYTFQSKVIGIAIATTALSQGQFGQFPLYVFTEDGIWAMETAADGSFVTSKPLSRDVCVNTKSITSIDNAVVFVSAQGVMLLQGSQVTNISPYMNGKHYVVENTAQSIIEGQDFFCDLLPAISDKTHFLAFVKEASVAYDYAGKRLVFIKDDEEYQYVYKLDTQTWHKVAYGINMQAVINSYPECLVQGKGGVPVRKTMCHVVTNTNKDGREYLVNYIKEYFFIELTEEQINAFLDGEYDIDVTHCEDSMKEQFFIDMSERALDIAFEERIETMECARIYDLSTLLDAQESMTPTRGIIATRPFDLGEPDILKTITDIRVRGQFPKGAVKFILLGSNDGVNFYTLSTLRGKSWKLFRMILLADLAPTDRISWVDVQYETKFTNRLR